MPPAVLYRSASGRANEPSWPTGSSWARRSSAPRRATWAGAVVGGGKVQIGPGNAGARRPRRSRCRPCPDGRPDVGRQRDSRASASWASRTTPRAPPTMAAAAVSSPMPPSSQIGPSTAATRRWSRTNAVSSPTLPPASAPLATSPWRAGREGGPGLGQGRDLGEHPAAREAVRADEADLGVGDDDRVHRGGGGRRGRARRGRRAGRRTARRDGPRPAPSRHGPGSGRGRRRARRARRPGTARRRGARRAGRRGSPR